MKEIAAPDLKRNNFDFLRFFFASLVIFSHSYPLANGNERNEPLAIFTKGQLTFGSLAVDCFFIMSGFLISKSWIARPSATDFLRKRIYRIYPGFLVAAILGAFVITPLFSTQGSSLISWEFVFKFIGRVVRLLDTTPGEAFQRNPAPGAVNGSLWSIQYEGWCYLGVLACGSLGLLTRRWVLVLGFVVSVVISFVFSWRHLTPGGGWIGVIFGYLPFWARLLPYFIIGMLFNSFRGPVTTALGAAVNIVLIVMASRIPYGLIFILPISAAYILIWFAYLPSLRLSRFAKYGDFSYGIYLYSFPVLQIIMYFAGAGLGALSLFALGWPISILLGAVSWYLVERRWLRSHRQIFQSPVFEAKPGI